MGKKETPAYFREIRIKKFREKLSGSVIEAAIIFKDANIYYLSGFYAKDSGSILCVSGLKIYLLVHFIYFEQAKRSRLSSGIELIQFKSIADSHGKLSSIISGISGKTIALEGNSISHNDYNRFADLIKKQNKKVVNLPYFIEELRKVKDASELNLIKKSCRINEKSFEYVLDKTLSEIKDLTEIDLAMQIERKMIELGAKSRAFDLIVAGNRSASLPHYESSDRKINKGLLLMDLGCRYRYYCSDITRTIFIGKSNKIDIFRKIYDIVLQAQIRAIDCCKEGISSYEIDKAARDYIAGTGYGDNFGHGLGHGVGLEVHEEPNISFTERGALKENMVITIEPGIYIEGLGGIRIEDMLIIKKDGCENIYSATKKLTVLE